MIQTGGLAILFAWLIFLAFLSLLAFFILKREDPDPQSEARKRPE